LSAEFSLVWFCEQNGPERSLNVSPLLKNFESNRTLIGLLHVCNHFGLDGLVGDKMRDQERVIFGDGAGEMRVFDQDDVARSVSRRS
jgi:hypothetical protein